MKKMLIVATLTALLAVGALWADGSSATVQNQEGWRFWYVLDPPGFAEEEPGSPWLTMKTSAFLQTEGGEFPFTALEPGESTTFEALAAGTHYLLGFFEDASLDEFPVRLIALQVDSSMAARHYDVYSLPELMMAARGQGMLAQFARAEEVATAEVLPAEEAAAAGEPAAEAVAATVEEEPVAEAAEDAVVEETAAEAFEATVEATIEEPVVEEQVLEAAEEPVAEGPAAEVQAAAVEEEPVPAATVAPAEEATGPEVLATFAESYDPVYFTRESHDGFVVLPIASSRAWGRPGTRLSAFSGALADGTFTLVLQSPDGFAENVSCFFYVFPVRSTGGASEYTFEARPNADGRAAVVLWQKGRAVPRLVGTAQTDGGAFTWTARADELPSELAQELGPAATLDLTTAWLDETSGAWEEFYFTTFAVADLTR